MFIRLEELKKYFPVKRGLLYKTVGHIKAVDGVSLEIQKGKTLGLVGESGCGKTTLGRVLLRLVEPDKGRIYFDDEEITNCTPARLRKLRKRMQIVFQDPFSSLDPRYSIGRVLSEGIRIFSMLNKLDAQRRVKELLSLVGLPEDAINRYPHEFSGGQRQRIAIARALSLEPSFIVLDEPVSSLDVSVQAQIINLLHDLQEKLSLTYLFIAHDLHVTRQFSDEVAVMYLGKIVERAASSELFEKPAHPYTRILIDAMPVADPQARKEHKGVTGEIASAFEPPSGCPFLNRCPLAVNLCEMKTPDLRELAPRHFVACHHY